MEERAGYEIRYLGSKPSTIILYHKNMGWKILHYAAVGVKTWPADLWRLIDKT